MSVPPSCCGFEDGAARGRPGAGRRDAALTRSLGLALLAGDGRACVTEQPCAETACDWCVTERPGILGGDRTVS